MKSSNPLKTHPNMVKLEKRTLGESDSIELETDEQETKVRKIYRGFESHIRQVEGVKASNRDNCHVNSMLAPSTLPGHPLGTEPMGGIATESRLIFVMLL
jgi:hypothetical protein